MKLKIFYLVITILTVTLFINNDVQSCSVPVFRYALERWKPDIYHAIYLYRDKISKEDRALLDQLQYELENPNLPLNLWVEEVDINSIDREDIKRLFKDTIPEDLPALALWYPKHYGEKKPFMLTKFTSSFVKDIPLSPKRREMAENIINGGSVAWIFIPSGKKEKDDKALSLIKNELKIALKKAEENPFYVLEGHRKVKLQYAYPVITLSHDDPDEKYFLKMLLGSESDLYEHTDEPMVFPVFGRGRVLGCLFGEYIKPNLIQDCITFLTGACSCEVKDLNPGTDIILAAPWEIVNYSFVDEDESELPELSGVAPVAPESFETDNKSKDSSNKGSEIADGAVEGADCNLLKAKSPIPKRISGDSANERKERFVFLTYGITLGFILILAAISTIVMKCTRKNK